jgi:hypothetical protein
MKLPILEGFTLDRRRAKKLAIGIQSPLSKQAEECRRGIFQPH